MKNELLHLLNLYYKSVLWQKKLRILTPRFCNYTRQSYERPQNTATQCVIWSFHRVDDYMMPCLLVISCYLRNDGSQLQTKKVVLSETAILLITVVPISKIFVYNFFYCRLLLLHLADINLKFWQRPRKIHRCFKGSWIRKKVVHQCFMWRMKCRTGKEQFGCPIWVHIFSSPPSWQN